MALSTPETSQDPARDGCLQLGEESVGFSLSPNVCETFTIRVTKSLMAGTVPAGRLRTVGLTSLEKNRRRNVTREGQCPHFGLVQGEVEK